MISHSARQSIPWYILSRPIEDVLVLFNARTNAFYVLDEIGSDIWLALLTTETIGQVHQALLEQYDITADELDVELEQFLTKLVQLGILVLDETLS